MRQSQSRESGTTVEERGSKPATGLRVRLTDDLREEVNAAAGRSDMEPKALVRDAVRQMVGDGNGSARVEVDGMNHRNDSASVTLGKPSTQRVEEAASGTDDAAGDIIRAQVRRVARRAQRRDAGRGGGAGGGFYLPAFDPAGVLEAVTGGMVRDPVRLALDWDSQSGLLPSGG